MNLVQMPDGNWINPRLIEAVAAHAKPRPMADGLVPPSPIAGDYVIISLRDLQPIVIKCASFEEAKKVRDEFAGRVLRNEPTHPGGSR